MSLRLKGLVAATPTPLQPDGSLNLAAVPPLVELLLRSRVEGLFACGTSGESASLTTAERQAVAAAFIAAAKARAPVIVQVGHASLRESQALAAHAQEARASAIAATPPYYFKPTSPAAVVDGLAEISSAAPRLPLYYYHIPSFTGVTVPLISILREAVRRLPALAGAKFTFENLMDYAQCVAFEDGRYDVLFGRDEMLLSALVLGARGAVGTTYNFQAPVFRRLWKAYDAGDLEAARREQLRAIRVIEILQGYGVLPALKSMVRFLGVDCGPNRKPLATLTPLQEAALKEELRAAGYFEWGAQ